MLQLPLKKKYDENMRNKAFSKLALRVLVAGYIFYLAWMLIFGSDSGEKSMPVWCVTLFCVIFIISSITFAVYAVRSFIKSLKAAEVSESSDFEEQ